MVNVRKVCPEQISNQKLSVFNFRMQNTTKNSNHLLENTKNTAYVNRFPIFSIFFLDTIKLVH